MMFMKLSFRVSIQLQEHVLCVCFFNKKSVAGAKRLSWTTQVKAVGLRGHGSEDGFLCMALNTHFGCSGPEGWHVETKKARKAPWVADLQRENRVHKLPAWVQYHLDDLILSKQMRICKPLPCPEEFLLNMSEASHWRCQTLTAKRKHVEKLQMRNWSRSYCNITYGAC